MQTVMTASNRTATSSVKCTPAMYLWHAHPHTPGGGFCAPKRLQRALHSVHMACAVHTAALLASPRTRWIALRCRVAVI